MTIAVGPFNLHFQLSKKMPGIIELRQTVGDGQLLKIRHHAVWLNLSSRSLNTLFNRSSNS